MATVDPSEVDRLADALFDDWNTNRALTPQQAQAELRALARAAAAVGARTALEDAATYMEQFDSQWQFAQVLRAFAATYAPEQERDNR